MFWHHPNGKCYGQAGWGNNGTIAYPDKAGRPGTGSTPRSGLVRSHRRYMRLERRRKRLRWLERKRLARSATSTTFTLTATPVAGTTQESDGTLTIDQSGKRAGTYGNWSRATLHSCLSP